MEPVATSTASLATKALSVIKDLPLWLLTAIALSLAAFLSIPKFGDSLSEAPRTWITAAALAFGIFAVCRFASVIISRINLYRASASARRGVHFT